ncbi:MAG: hypothetical protein KYX65_09405, partial [Tabrizicola sp.]|nr:hypothetical protein [Tabrizicola sp.]
AFGKNREDDDPGEPDDDEPPKDSPQDWPPKDWPPRWPDRPIRTRKPTMEEVLRALRGEGDETGMRGVKTMRLELDFDDD